MERYIRMLIMKFKYNPTKYICDIIYLMENLMSYNYIVSIDASIQSSGVSIYNTKTKTTILYTYSNKVKEDFEFEVAEFKLIAEAQPKKFKTLDYFIRYTKIADRIYEFISNNIDDSAIFFMEGYAFAAKGKMFNIGEFGGLIKRHIYDDNYPLKEIAPSEWKKRIIGSGSAKKEVIYNSMLRESVGEVLAELVARGYPWKKHSWVEDIADVYAIQKCAMFLT